MGLSSSKSKSTNNPSAFAKPYVTAGADALGSAYARAQPTIDAAQATLTAALPQLGERAFGDNPGLDAATSYNTAVLNGDYLDEGNPYLGKVLDRTAADVRSRVATSFTNAGRTGSGANAAALSRGLGDALGAIQYGDYANERNRMGQAASLAPTLNRSQYDGLGAYLQAVQAATGLPMDAARSYAGGIGSLVGGYNTQTNTTSPGLGLLLAQAAGNAASAWAGGGFK